MGSELTLTLIRERRMFLIQVAAGEDSPTSDIHRLASDADIIFRQILNVCRSPCAGMVLRGTNKRQPADLDKRHEN